MEDKEYDKVQKRFRRFKRSKYGKMYIKEIDRILFNFYLEGYIENSKLHSEKKDEI